MPTATKIQAVDQNWILDLVGSPVERSAALAEYAREQLAEGEAQNVEVLGRAVPYTTTGDGAEGASEDRVKPDGEIVYEFELVTEAVEWVRAQLIAHSPIGSGNDKHPGLYSQSHALFADGDQVDAGAEVPIASEYVFVNLTAYARAIERGESSQAPSGVYQGVAAMAAAQFGNSVAVSFEYRAPENGALLSYAQTRTKRASAARERDLRVPAVVLTSR